jgi:hypothetical protein
MAIIVLDKSMSLDGFIAGPQDNAPLGSVSTVNGCTLGFPTAPATDPRTFRPSGPSGEIFDELMATGAVLAGVSGLAEWADSV